MKSIFSNNLRSLRIDNDYSQQEIANILGISRSRYANYENALSEPSLNILVALSNFYHCSVDDLLKIKINTLLTEKPKLSVSLDEFNYCKLKNQLINHKTFYENKKKTILNEIDNKIKEIDHVIEFLEKSKLEIANELSNDFRNKYEKYLYKPIEILTADFYGAIPCGDPSECSNESYETIDIPLIDPLKENTEYFVLEANGDSMDEFIDDGEYLVIEKTNTCYNGNIVVALVNGNNTLKEFYSTSSHLILKPRSSNPIHEEQIYPFPTDIKIQGKFICKLSDLNDTYEKILEMQSKL